MIEQQVAGASNSRCLPEMQEVGTELLSKMLYGIM